jgi:hypothetical protein
MFSALPLGEARQTVLGIADGRVLGDDTCVYVVRDMRVGLITRAICSSGNRKRKTEAVMPPFLF